MTSQHPPTITVDPTGYPLRVRASVPPVGSTAETTLRLGGRLDAGYRAERGSLHLSAAARTATVSTRLFVIRTALVLAGMALVIFGGGRLFGMALLHWLGW